MFYRLLLDRVSRATFNAPVILVTAHRMVMLVFAEARGSGCWQTPSIAWEDEWAAARADPGIIFGPRGIFRAARRSMGM